MGFQAVIEFLCRFVHDAVLFLFRELVVRCVRLDGRQDFDDVVVRPVFVDEGRHDGVIGDAGHLGRSVSRQGVHAKEFDHDAGIARVLVHEQADVVAVAEEADHVADARLVSDVLLHHGPVLVDEGIGALAVLFLSNGDEGIAIHGQDSSQEFPVAGMGCHEDGPFAAGFEFVQVFLAVPGNLFVEHLLRIARIRQDFDDHGPEPDRTGLGDGHGLFRIIGQTAVQNLLLGQDLALLGDESPEKGT